MGKYWQPCGDSKDCQVEDEKMQCVEKAGLPKQRWCDCLKGWDLREGWCVNSTLKEIQKDEYVKLKQIEFIEKEKMDDAGEFKFLVVFIQISIILLGTFIVLAFIWIICRKLIRCITTICTN